MTEAVTPYDKPDQPPSESPSAATAAGAAPAPEPAFSPSDIRDGAAIALVTGVAGVLLGLLWVWLAPRVQFVSNGEAVFLRDTESEARIGADGTFLLLSVGFGVLSALGVFLWRRGGGAAQVIGLAVGSVFATLVGWRVGLWLGPTSDLAAAARKAGKGVPFEAPLELLAHGALLGWPMAAVVVHLALTALWGTRDPAPELAMWPSAYYQAPVDSADSPAPSPSVYPDPSGTEPPRP
ncbi:hypothetical protein [Streptomyces sp. AP-93]|uniref:hypothetical protein n=1 Tax=Streptomyces sp. AP-93 TaxID=2929048 RepID=UPI001FAF1CD8|nr:hypothetical protein [Streptomyces sp. AP-93]MCJ0868290.1 hypothetical protein [Streptomyces sp. AP-93]